MAVTSIWRIKGTINKVILYATNPKKTEEIENKNGELTAENILNVVINYTERDSATQIKKYVSGVNCSVNNPMKEMLNVKKHFGKTGGTVGYHGYQSFAEDEVDADTAHKIGCELANRLWGERYQVLVATHIDKYSHIHNHFILNTVSFVDGKKYHRTNSDYLKMRQISDDLCREYGLSVIENPKSKSRKPYDLYMAEKNGEWTKDAIIKRDIDECILKTTSERAFYTEMKKLGYTFNFNRKYPTISHPKFERPRRLKTLGEGYTPQDIERRLMSKWQRYKVEIPEQDNLVREFFEPLNEPNYKEVYVSFVTVVRYVKKNPNTNREIDKYLIDEMRKLDKLIEQQNLLCDNDIETPEQLSEYKTSCENELRECDEARNRLRKMLKSAVRKGDEKETTELKDHISTLTERMKILRKDIRICDRIQEQEPKIENKINEIINDKERKEMSTDERFRRRSGTNRENDITRR